MTGGRNGFGAKLANIFSRQFQIETGNSQTRQVYKQTWRNNMSEAEEPVISKVAMDNYTKVTFWPDFKRFSMKAFDEDIVALLSKRVYDIAGITDGKVKV